MIRGPPRSTLDRSSAASDVYKRQVWSFAYPEQGDFASSELVLPVDRTIVLKMTAEDVIHSFWVPEFLSLIHISEPTRLY